MKYLVPLFVMGQPGVGKRTFVQQLTNGQLYHNIQDKDGLELILKPKIVSEIPQIQIFGLVLVYNITDNSSYEYIQDIAKQLNPQFIVLAGTHRDQQQKRQVSYDQAMQLKDQLNGVWAEYGKNDNMNFTQIKAKLTIRAAFTFKEIYEGEQPGFLIIPNSLLNNDYDPRIQQNYDSEICEIVTDAEFNKLYGSQNANQTRRIMSNDLNDKKLLTDSNIQTSNYPKTKKNDTQTECITEEYKQQVFNNEQEQQTLPEQLNQQPADFLQLSNVEQNDIKPNLLQPLTKSENPRIYYKVQNKQIDLQQLATDQNEQEMTFEQFEDLEFKKLGSRLQMKYAPELLDETMNNIINDVYILNATETQGRLAAAPLQATRSTVKEERLQQTIGAGATRAVYKLNLQKLINKSSPTKNQIQVAKSDKLICSEALVQKQLHAQEFKIEGADFIIELIIEEQQFRLGVRKGDNAYKLSKDFAEQFLLTPRQQKEVTMQIFDNIQQFLISQTKSSMTQSKKGRRVLFKVEFDVGDECIVVPFKEGDTPELVAQRFCKEMKLSESQYFNTITQKINNTKQLYTSSLNMQ